MKIRFDRFELDTNEKSVSGPDGPVPLRPQTFAVLCCLLEHAPAVVSRDQLLDEVWGHQATSFSSVAQTITELRQALGDSTSKPRLIATRRRLGYQFIAAAEKVDAALGNGEPGAATTVIPPPSVAVRRYWPIAALLAMAAVIFALTGPGRLPQPLAPENRMPVIAIANMVNATEDDTLDWLAPALETYLGHALVELGGVRVLAVDPPVAEGEPRLEGIDFLVEGRYLSAGIDGARLMAQLRRPGNREILTSLESGHGEWNVIELSLSLAESIRQGLGLERSPDADRSTLRVRLPASAEAQRGYFEALAAIEAGRPDQALARIAETRRSAPESAQLDHLQSLAEGLRGDLIAARENIARALAETRLWPRRDRLDLEATAAMLNFDFDIAADRLQALNEFFPEPGITRRLIEAQIAAGRLAPALETLNSLQQMQPNDPRLALLQARLAGAERDHPGQLEAASRAAELGAGEIATEARLAEAQARIEMGQMDAAEAALADAMQGATTPLQQARVRLTDARIHFLQGRLDEALEAALAAEVEFGAIPAPIERAEAGLTIADIHDRAGRIGQAIDAIQAASETFETLGDRRRLARADIRRSDLLARDGRTGQAVEGLIRAASQFRSLGDRQGEGAAQLNHGLLLARSGRLIDAEPIFQRALEAFRDASDLRGEALALGNLAAIAGDRRDMRRSTELAEQSLSIFELLGAQTDIARVSYNLGLIHRREGDLLSAESRVRQAADAFASQGAVLMQTRALTTLGAILVGAGRLNDVDAIMAEIDGLAIEDAAELAVVHNVRGERALQLGRLDEARAEFSTGRELMESIGADNHALVSRLNLGRVALAEGALVQAEQEGREMVRRFTEIRVPHRETDSLLLVAAALIEQQRNAEAERILADVDARLDAAPDAEQRLRAALLRSRIAEPEMAQQHLDWVEQTAGRQGFLPLLLAAQELRPPSIEAGSDSTSMNEPHSSPDSGTP